MSFSLQYPVSLLKPIYFVVQRRRVYFKCRVIKYFWFTFCTSLIAVTIKISQSDEWYFFITCRIDNDDKTGTCSNNQPNYDKRKSFPYHLRFAIQRVESTSLIDVCPILKFRGLVVSAFDFHKSGKKNRTAYLLLIKCIKRTSRFFLVMRLMLTNDKLGRIVRKYLPPFRDYIFTIHISPLLSQAYWYIL